MNVDIIHKSGAVHFVLQTPEFPFSFVQKSCFLGSRIFFSSNVLGDFSFKIQVLFGNLRDFSFDC